MTTPVASEGARKISREAWRGSRKHVLDWVEQPAFLAELERLAAPAPVRIEPRAWHMPKGYDEPAEARLERGCPILLSDGKTRWELRDWWLTPYRRANTPNWELAVECSIGGRRGLLLVEAKANEPELAARGRNSTSLKSAAPSPVFGARRITRRLNSRLPPRGRRSL